MGILHRENLTESIVRKIILKNGTENLAKYVAEDDLLLMQNILLGKNETKFNGVQALVSMCSIRETPVSIPKFGDRLCESIAVNDMLLSVRASLEKENHLLLTVSKSNKETVFADFERCFKDGDPGYVFEWLDGGKTSAGVECMKLLLSVDEETEGIPHGRLMAIKVQPTGTVEVVHISEWSTSETGPEYKYDRETEDFKIVYF